jgi:hypothetical protein
VREPAHRAVPKEIEDWDIARIVKDYAAAAARMQAAGLDGIELECYGHLIDQFWSPATNLRGDEYNGSLDNRLRLHLPGAGRDTRRRCRARIHRRLPAGGRRGLGQGPFPRGRAGDLPPPGGERADRLPQRDPRPYRA